VVLRVVEETRPRTGSQGRGARRPANCWVLSLVLGFCAFLGAALLPFAGQLVLLCGYGGRRVLRAGTRAERALTALGLIAEIGDFARFSHPRELASWLGITPSEYTSGDRGHITKAGSRHARRLLVEVAWHYRHAPRRPTSGPQPDERAWQAQIRLHHRYRHLTAHGKRPTVVNIAIARELTGFLWAAMTDQPIRSHGQPQEAAAQRKPQASWWGRAAGVSRPEDPRWVYAIPTRDFSSRQLTTGHCPAVPTRASQSDSRRCPVGRFAGSQLEFAA
jgi:hypothetical protein